MSGKRRGRGTPTRAPAQPYYKLIVGLAPQSVDGKTKLTPQELARYESDRAELERAINAMRAGGMTHAEIEHFLSKPPAREFALLEKRRNAVRAAASRRPSLCPYTAKEFDNAKTKARGKQLEMARELQVDPKTLRKYGRPDE
jgi:DNA-binding transcriptional MerR regulator